MTLTLYSHPLAAFCHKVLIAFYELGIPFETVTVDFGDPGSAAAHMERWPVGKIPVLHDSDAGKTIPETTIIVEYVQQNYAGSAHMLPLDPEVCLNVRLWDRFFDLYVSEPMQKIVTDRLRPEGEGDTFGIAQARKTLDTAYGMIEQQLAGRSWAAGDSFSLADCAAAPALFYALIVHPSEDDHPELHAYFERLLARESVRQVLRDARPYFSLFPYREAMPERFLEL